MTGLTFEAPANMRDALRVPVGEQGVRLRRELAIWLYEKWKLPFVITI